MHQAANVIIIYLFERAQGPGRVVSVWANDCRRIDCSAIEQNEK